MSRLSKSSRLLKTAEAALISSIEIYNKPAFAYREETFAILALNAWELLLKSQLLNLNNNDARCLYVKISPTSGTTPKRLRFKRNRTGNIMTIGIDACIVAIEKRGTPVPAAVKTNLEALTEIRDNVFTTSTPALFYPNRYLKSERLRYATSSNSASFGLISTCRHIASI